MSSYCTGCGKVISGAVGLIKAATGSDAAPLTVVKAHRDICRECPEATRNPAPKYAVNKGLTSLSRCRKCDCFISAKTLLISEVCPLKKW